jgi:ABC-type amino acid transport substrate-binding protein
MRRISVLLFWILGAQGAMAQGVPPQLSVCFSEWAPYSTLIHNHPDGLSIRVMQAVADQMHRPVAFKLLPWKRCLEQVANHQIDLALDGFDRPGLIHGAVGMTQGWISIWVRQDSPIETHSGDQLMQIVRGKRISASRDDNAALFDFGVIPDLSPSIESALLKLAEGRTDFAAGDLLALSDVALKNSIPVRALNPAANGFELQPLAAPDRAELVAEIDRALLSLREAGAIDRLYIEMGFEPPSALRNRFGKMGVRIQTSDALAKPPAKSVQP